MASIDTVRLHTGYDLNDCRDRGPRWTCEYCGAVNPDHLFRCDNCYAPRLEEECEEPREVDMKLATIQAVMAMQTFGQDMLMAQYKKRLMK